MRPVAAGQAGERILMQAGNVRSSTPLARIATGVALAASVAVAQPGWRVGLASAKITPDGPIRLDGYAERTRPSEGVISDIHAKAMAIEDGAGLRALLITVDIIGFAFRDAKVVHEAIAAETGLPADRILLNASHTHTGPVVVFDGLGGGSFSAEEREAVFRYTRWLCDRLVDVSSAALRELAPAALAWGTGAIDFAVNRRRAADGNVRMGPNPEGTVDRSVPVLLVTSPEADPRAVVFGYACHNTTLTPRHNQVSADYAGFAQAFLESVHPGMQAMFVSGCAGSANPFPRGSVEAAKSHRRALGSEVCRVLSGPLRPLDGPLRVATARADIPLAPVPPREQLLRDASSAPGPRRTMAARMLRRLDAGQALASCYPTPVSVWQFGDDLTLVGLSGEVAGEYVPLLQQALGTDGLWIGAYCREVFGYLVTADMLAEGGYETRGLFHEPGVLAPGAETALISVVRDLARRAGRRLPE